MALVTREFQSLAQTSAKSLGYPDLPMVVLPHPFETLPVDEMKRLAAEKLEEICSRLTVPLAARH
ncbi:MAG: hypothetical protein AAB502_05575 [Chloroflexota bacterium]